LNYDTNKKYKKKQMNLDKYDIGTNEYVFNEESSNKIGEGGFSVIFKSFSSLNKNKQVALKQINLNVSANLIQSAIQEINILVELRHDNIIELMDHFYTPDYFYLVYELLDIDLDKIIHNNKNYPNINLNPETIKLIFKQILLGIEHCHENKIIHRDLKPSNILLNIKNDNQIINVKIADFGLARSIKNVSNINMTNQVVTLNYKSPDIILGNKKYDESIDIWSLGCIFYEMFFKEILFKGIGDESQLVKIFKLKGIPNFQNWPDLLKLPEYNLILKYKNIKITRKIEINEFFNENAKKLLFEFIAYKPQDRISVKNALKHDYFNK
jgi:serine/threonine protein kinase